MKLALGLPLAFCVIALTQMVSSGLRNASLLVLTTPPLLLTGDGIAPSRQGQRYSTSLARGKGCSHQHQNKD